MEVETIGQQRRPSCRHSFHSHRPSPLFNLSSRITDLDTINSSRQWANLIRLEMQIQTQVDRRPWQEDLDLRRRMDLRSPAMDRLRLVDQCLVDLRFQAMGHHQEQALEDRRHRRRQDLEL